MERSVSACGHLNQPGCICVHEHVPRDISPSMAPRLRANPKAAWHVAGIESGTLEGGDERGDNDL